MRSPTDPSGTARRPRARKRFGQNFLEPAWARKVVTAIAPLPSDAFIEIGPGPGAITQPLADACGSVLACELDRDLAAAMRAAQLPRVTVFDGDFLRHSPEQLTEALRASAPHARSFRVAGNLPYNVASPIMFRLVELARIGMPLQDATIMLQREVAERLIAVPGTSDYGVLTVLIGHRARATRLLNLPPGAFRPAPKVHSSVVRLVFHPPEPPVLDEGIFSRLVNAVFSRRRKTLGNALLALGGLSAAHAAEAARRAGIDPVRRPETLTIAEFAALADALSSIGRTAGSM